MLTIVMTKWDNTEEPGILLLDADETIIQNEEQAKQALVEAYKDFEQTYKNECPNIDNGDIASSITNAFLQKHGFTIQENQAMLVSFNGWENPNHNENFSSSKQSSTNSVATNAPEITVEVDEHGLNKQIQFHLLEPELMQKAKFRHISDSQLHGPYWYFCRTIAPETTINVTIYENGDRGRIDILDELFCQPYDYQLLLSTNPNHEFANNVRNEVENTLAELTQIGIISGHNPGDYV